MDENRRTAIVVGLSLVGISVFTGLFFALFVLTRDGPEAPAPIEAPAP